MSIQHVFTWSWWKKILEDAASGKVHSKIHSMFDLINGTFCVSLTLEDT